MARHMSNPQRSYDEPFSWWGYRDAPEDPLSIIQLMRQGTLDARTSAFLWMALEQRASLVVAAEPQEAGKTTVLTALLDFLPSDIERIYLRGWYERFAFLNDNHDPSQTYLLSNEISSHLPTYLWGRGVRQLFDVARSGYAFATTVHAKNAEAVVQLLTSYPLDVPRDQISVIDLVVNLGVRVAAGRGITRRVMSVEVITDRAGDPLITSIADREVLGTELVAEPGRLISVLVQSFGLESATAATEFARRERFLNMLLRLGIDTPDRVRNAIRRYPENPT